MLSVKYLIYWVYDSYFKVILTPFILLNKILLG